jgi:hypothetical protein
MITKLTELECVSFLKYDDLYNKISGGKLSKLKSKISQINQGKDDKLRNLDK